MSLQKELRELEEKGIDLIEILGEDRHLRSPQDLQNIIGLLKRVDEDDEFYAELLQFLTHRRFTAAQAKAIWGAIQRHKRHMTERLGRPVKFRVAALDYLTSKSSQLRGVRLIAREELESLLGHVNIDEVTSAFTRRYFNERLLQEVNRARRYGSSLSLLVIDLDNFKKVNDELGHVRGDALLRKVGRALRENTRQADAVCRYGGDEFAVILPETNNSEAYTLAERIRTAAAAVVRAEMGERPAGDGRGADGRGAEGRADGGGAAEGGPLARTAIAVGVSIGGATFPEDCDEAEELVARADRHCLEAKRAGKNSVRMSGERREREPPQAVLHARPEPRPPEGE